MILSAMFKPRPTPEKALYDAIVAAARQPVFYRDWAVLDTIDGRFDMLVLHLWLIASRLRGVNDPLRQALVDRFCSDMDGNLRELGASDVTVGKKVRFMAEAFQGRYVAYDAVTDKATLILAIERNVYAGASAPNAGHLADYVLRAVDLLATQDTLAIASGRVAFK